MNIVTITMNPSIDISTKIDNVSPDRKLRCEEPTYEFGGGGLNVSHAIKNLGDESLAIYPYGGKNGELLFQLLENARIESLPIAIEGSIRENFTVIEKSSGRNFRFVMPGPELKENEWNKIIEIIHDMRDEVNYLVASGSLPKGVPSDFYAKLADCCKQDKIKMIIDASGESLKNAVEQGVFLIKPNMREINDLLGEELIDENKISENVQNIIRKSKTENVVLSLGSGGAMLITENNCKIFRTPTVQIKSKVGAGDSMVAGIILKLSEGKEIEEAVKYGIAAGASAVSMPGSQLCEKKYTDELFNKISSES
ncbi:MAG: 1-phosphofructokinase family hexose kinase [Ignavibacteriae bacterium]|nr:1-phosphofructokinase family hexose kinase [Ignavibacteriota bacterium]